MALFDKTLQDAGLSFFRDSPNRNPTVIIQDHRQQKIAVLDSMAMGNNAFTGDVNTPDIRYSVYSTAENVDGTGWRLTPLSKAAGNFLNPQAGYAAHGSNFYFNTIPSQMLLANSSMACGLLCNVVSDGANSTGEFTGYMHTLNNWNRSLNREQKATKCFDGGGFTAVGQPTPRSNIYTYVVFPTATSTRAGSALEHDVNTQIRAFDANNASGFNVMANSIIGGMGAGTTFAGGGQGSQLTTTPWWSTYNMDFIEYMSTPDRIVGVTVRNGSTSTLQKVQPGGGGLIAINNAFQKSVGSYANLYAVANSTTGRVANTLGLETNPSLTFIGRPKIISYGNDEASNTTFMFINSRVASFSAGLVDVSTNVFSNAVAFTITSGTDNKWCGTPSMLYQRTGDAATTVRFAMSEIQALNAGRRIREYTFATTTAVAAAQGNSVTFANTSWETPTGTTAHTDSSPLYGYLATITSTIGGNNTPTITQIPIETWNRPSSFLTNNNMIRWATAYITTTGNGIEAVDSANSYLPPEPPLAVYPITEDQSQLLVMYNEFAEFVELQALPGVTPTVYGKWVRTSTYPYPLRTASMEYQFFNGPPSPKRLWAYDKNGAIHVFNRTSGGEAKAAYATFTLANSQYEYTGNVISTFGNLDVYATIPSANAKTIANVEISLVGGGLRFSDNTTVKVITSNGAPASTNVALQIVGPGSTQILIKTQMRS